MKEYVVVSSKPVRVRLGTQEKSELKVFKKDEEFKTSEAFAKDLASLGYIKEKEAPKTGSSKKTEGK